VTATIVQRRTRKVPAAASVIGLVMIARVHENSETAVAMIEVAIRPAGVVRNVIRLLNKKPTIAVTPTQNFDLSDIDHVLQAFMRMAA
jgi:hypothetical protein